VAGRTSAISAAAESNRGAGDFDMARGVGGALDCDGLAGEGFGAGFA